MILDPPDKSSDVGPLTEGDPPAISPWEDLCRLVSRVRYDRTTGEPVTFPSLNSAEDLAVWAERIELCLNEAAIPIAQWSDAAILFLEDLRINVEMRKMKKRQLEKEQGVWPWEEFKASLAMLLVERDSRTSIQKLKEDHPAVVAAAGACLVIAGGSVLVPALVVSSLNSAGFASGGVAAGSWATTIQSTVYGGATSGLFSICQSIGATAVPASAEAVLAAIRSVAVGVSLMKNGIDASKK